MAADLVGRPLLDVLSFPTAARPLAWVKDVARQLERILAAHPELGECVGVGVVVPGMVDLHGGRLKHCPTLGWRDVDILEPLRQATRLPVVVENDCKACALAQVWAVTGDVPMEGPLAFVNVTDGVGVGIAIDGKLLRGAHNTSGEFGHVALNMYDRAQYLDDIALLKDLGVNAYRFSLNWPRILPDGTGAPNPTGIAYYRGLIADLKRVGIEPLVTLYHWELPQALAERGGWANREIVGWFRHYAGVVFDNIGSDVNLFLALNEPSTDLGFSVYAKQFRETPRREPVPLTPLPPAA